MKAIDLTKSELFKNLIEVTLDEIQIDLHNNYNCVQIVYDKMNSQLSMKFMETKSDNLPKPFICIDFEGVIIANVALNFQSVTGSLTLDNFYRGKFEVNNTLGEYSDDGRSYFYIEFYEDCALELQSNEVKLLYFPHGSEE